MGQKAKKYLKKSMDPLLTRLQACLNNTDSIKAGLACHSTKIDQVSTDLTEEIEGIPNLVRTTLNLSGELRHHRDAITPLITSLRDSLTQGRDEVSEFARASEEQIREGFESMMEKLTENLTLAEQIKSRCSEITKRVGQSCEDVSEQLGTEFEMTSEKVDLVNGGVKDLNDLLLGKPPYRHKSVQVSVLHQDDFECRDFESRNEKVERAKLDVKTIKD